jgi:3'(2'), 5'-bisphosphate nucleotidase
MFEKELEAMIEAGLEAKKVIMEVYNTHFDVEIKSDNSPVTKADKAADKLIREYLQKRFPDYGFLTEESEDNLERLNKEYIFVVDPVDGTKDFVVRDGMFTTNIGLIHNHEVVAGVVLIPCQDEYYYASKGNGSYYVKEGSNPIKIHVSNNKSNLKMVTSCFHIGDRELEIFKNHPHHIAQLNKVGSAIKFCLIAKGEADVMFRFGEGTKEWDTAAGQIVVTEAGGEFVHWDKSPITYNKKDVYHHDGYVILNSIDNFYKI